MLLVVLLQEVALRLILNSQFLDSIFLGGFPLDQFRGHVVHLLSIIDFQGVLEIDLLALIAASIRLEALRVQDGVLLHGLPDAVAS